MSIIHVPDSAFAKEATKWEAQGSTLGPGLRPYVKRDYPMMLYRAYQKPEGGIDILDNTIVDDPEHRVRLEANGYRPTPLEAMAALEAQQTEFAKLSAERAWEKQHRLSPRAVAEVNAVEEDAGAQHLPTIPETPHGLRGTHVTSDRELKLEAELEALKAQLVAKPKRGRPKKVTADA